MLRFTAHSGDIFDCGFARLSSSLLPLQVVEVMTSRVRDRAAAQAGTVSMVLGAPMMLKRKCCYNAFAWAQRRGAAAR